RDLGRAVGCGAHVAALRRVASGAFSLDDAVSLAEAEAVLAANRGESLLRPLDLAVQDLPAVAPGPDGLRALRQGQPWRPPSEATPQVARANDDQGRLVAIVEG